MRRLVQIVGPWVLIAWMCIGTPVTSNAQARGIDLGLRFDVLVGDGEPTNDVIGQALTVRWGDRWRVEVDVVHSPEFDVERTPRMLDIVQDPDVPDIDSKASSTGVRVFIERWYGEPSRRTAFFWGVGGGADSIDVDDVSGQTASGASFTIRTDAGTQVVLAVLGGLQVRLGEHWAIEASLRAEQHFADWELQETVSGRTASVSSYLLTGIQAGVVFRF